MGARATASSFEFSSLLRLCAVVAILLTFSGASALAQDVIVDDDGQATAPSDCGGTAVAPSTIGGGVTAAAPGATVVVCPGTYAENVVINKALTLEGNNAGTPGSAARTTETLVIPQNDNVTDGVIFDVRASNVTIDGFFFDADSPSLSSDYDAVQGVAIDANATSGIGNVTVQNNVFDGFPNGSQGATVFPSGIYGVGASTGNIIRKNRAQQFQAYQSTGGVESANAGIALVNRFQATLTDNSSFEVAFGILLSGNGVMPTVTGGRHDGNHRGIVIYPGVVDSEYDIDGATAVNSFEFGMVIFRFDGAAQGLGNGNQDVTATLRNVVADTTRAPTGSNDAAGIAANAFVGTGVYEVTIENATVRGNFNRGVNVRGTDMTATLSGSEVLGNGYAPTDPAGNDGFSVIVREAATLTVTNTLVQAPVEGVTTDNVQLIHAAANNPLLTVRQSRLDLNQNSLARFSGGFSSTTQASGNAWVSGATKQTGPQIQALSYASIDFSPYLTASGDTDTGTLGFQPDDSGYTATKGGQQFANNQISTPFATRIAEAIALVNNASRGTVTLEQIFAGSGNPFDQPFSENVTVNRTNVSLVSANNEGTPGNGSRGDESVLTGTSGAAITVAANGATIDGLQLEGAQGVVLDGTSASATGLTVQNNRFLNQQVGASITDVTSGGGGITITQNLVDLAGQFFDSNNDGTAEASSPTAGFNLRTIDLATPPSLTNNFFQDTDGNTLTTFYGIIFDGVNGESGTNSGAATISGGTISGTAQAIAILDGEEGTALVNTSGGQTPDESTFSISNVTMNGFIGDATNVDGEPGNSLDAIDFHAGVFVYTGASPGTPVTTQGSISGLDIQDVGNAGGDGAPSAGLYFGGFSSEFGDGNFSQETTVDDVSITESASRGIFLRGDNTTAFISNVTLADNGNVGSSADIGASIKLEQGGTITLTNSEIRGPSSSSNAGPVIDFDNASSSNNPSPFNATLTSNVIEQNGGSTVLLDTGTNLTTGFTVDASQNVWLTGGTVLAAGSDVAGEITASGPTATDYTPWLLDATDTDGATAGFQGNTADLGIDSGSAQVGTMPRFEEALALGAGTSLAAYGTAGEYELPNPVQIPNILVIGSDLDFATGPSDITVAAELVVNPSATSITDSPNFILQNVFTGTAGAGTDGNPGADAGWRMFAVPRSNGTGAEVGDDLDLFSANGNSALITWNASTQQYESATTSTSLPSGSGFWVYFFDDQRDPIEPTNPLVIDTDAAELDFSTSFPTAGNFGVASLEVTLPDVAAATAPPAADGTTPGNKVHLLGNPYAQSFDVSDLRETSSGDPLGANGNFSGVVKVWDPFDGTDGGYQDVSINTGSSADVIAPWQAFWVERTSSGSEAALDYTFQTGGRTQGAAFIPAKSGSRSGTIDVRVALRDDRGTILSDDRSGFYFRNDLSVGTDAYDASKYAPFINSGRYVEMALQDPEIEGRYLSQMSLPYDFASRIKVPARFRAVNLSGTAEVSLGDRSGVPESWTVFLTDTARDTSVALSDGQAYTFELAENASSASRFVFTVSPDGTLPVELSRFTGSSEGRSVVLSWATASETNNAGFRVQQSTPSGSFKTLGFVEGNRTTTEPQSYRFRANGVDYGTHTYRLQQVDLDGQTSLSKTLSVTVSLDAPFEVGSVAPNPIRDRGTFDVTVRDAQQVQVLVYDALGRRVARLHDGPMPANRSHTFDVGTLRLGSGHYFLRVQGETFRETRRVVVVR